MIIGYCRVSSREQLTNSEALAQQRARVAPYCDEIIEDIKPRTMVNRPGFERVKELVIAGVCKKIVCTRLDRLGTLSMIPQVLELHNKYGCEIVCLDDEFNPSTATGRFHANIVASVAQMEVEMLSERVRHGIDYFKSQGKTHSAPFGYRITRDNRLELDHEPCLCLLDSRKTLSRYDIARMIVGWYLNPPPDEKGRRRSSLIRTVQLLNETLGIQILSSDHPGRGRIRFGTSGLSKWLSSKTLSGHRVYGTKDGGEIIHSNTHEPLITPEEAQAIATNKKSNVTQSFVMDSPRRQFAMSGLVFCPHCRRTMRLFSGSRGRLPGYNFYYKCPRWLESSCKNKKGIRVEKTEEILIDKLVERAALIADWYEQGDPVGALPLPPGILELQRSLATLENLPYNPAIEESKRGLRIQIETAIAQNQEKNRTGLQRNELLMELGDRGFWRSVSEDEKVRLYRMFVAAIWVDRGEVVGVDFL